MYPISTIGAGVLLALTVTLTAQAEIISAKFSDETTRYAHGILGDAIEYGGLKITTDDPEKTYHFKLPKSHVFEDIAPRLVDVTGDGLPEVVVIETDRSKGASIAVYSTTGKIAETPHIGRPHRWLAPVGIADFDGDGHIDIAYIDRPHLVKTLRVWRFKDNKLVEIAHKTGLTNHQIGWDYIAGGLRDCGGAVEMITADGAWRNVMATRLDGDQLVSRRIGAFSGVEDMNAALVCEN